MTIIVFLFVFWHTADVPETLESSVSDEFRGESDLSGLDILQRVCSGNTYDSPQATCAIS